MKCEYCGFVSSEDFHRCPYCGTESDGQSDLLGRSIKVGNLFSIHLRTLFIAILANILLFALFIDAWTKFQFCISYWLLIIFSGIYVFVSALTSRKSLIASAELIDVAILLGLCLGTVAFKFEPLFDFRRFMPTIVIPIASTFGSVFSIGLVFAKSKTKFRPLWTEILLITHLAVMLVIFAFFLFAKFGPWTELTQYFILPGAWAIAQEIFIYIGTALASVYLVNYNLVVFGHIVKEVKVRYGGEKRDD